MIDEYFKKKRQRKNMVKDRWFSYQVSQTKPSTAITKANIGGSISTPLYLADVALSIQGNIDNNISAQARKTRTPFFYTQYTMLVF